MAFISIYLGTLRLVKQYNKNLGSKLLYSYYIVLEEEVEAGNNIGGRSLFKIVNYSSKSL